MPVGAGERSENIVRKFAKKHLCTPQPLRATKAHWANGICDARILFIRGMTDYVTLANERVWREIIIL
jgi:hypothetical protein